MTKNLPKFDNTPALATGLAVSLLLAALNLWAAIARWSDLFIPFQLGRILAIPLGIVLAIHCADMIGYYRQHGGAGGTKDESKPKQGNIP